MQVTSDSRHQTQKGQGSMRRIRSIIEKKCSISVDIPSSHGGLQRQEMLQVTVSWTKETT